MDSVQPVAYEEQPGSRPTETIRHRQISKRFGKVTAPIVKGGRGDDLGPVGHVCHGWPCHRHPCRIVPCLQRKNICLDGASGRKMEESEGRLAYSLGHDLCDCVSPSNRLFDLPDARWLPLRLSMGVSCCTIHAKCNNVLCAAYTTTAGQSSLLPP